MSFTGFDIPTYTEVRDTLVQYLNANLPGADSTLRRSVLNTIARATAAGIVGLYGFLSWVSDQTNILFAEGENLNKYGEMFDVPRLVAQKATGSITATGTNGSVIPTGSILTRSDGVEFETTEQGNIVGGTATIEVEAVLAGEDGNTAASTTLTFASPISGVDSTATVVTLVDGRDEEIDGAKETTEGYRGRLLNHLQEPPSGGTDEDYVRWAKEVDGVTNAWAEGNVPDVGDVTVYFMMYDTYDDGIPLSGDIAVVQNNINLRRPITANAIVAAPAAKEMDVEIGNLENDTSQTRAAIEANLQDMLRRVARPGGTIHVSKVIEAISITAGEDSHDLVTPSSNFTTTSTEIATLGTITYS